MYPRRSTPQSLTSHNSEYMLWTDGGSREFIAEHYPWFLDTFDGYTYPIQRADAIRYFVLHHFGGVYIDLDVGCLRPLDPLLQHSVILPKTIPVGVSNDLMFSEKAHPFMAQTIHNLVTFDHSWILNYPTVMFSTGPMFLSIQYGLWSSSHPIGEYESVGDVRVLPKSLYGKNAKPGEAPHAYFEHFYGSSWHADDAAFIGFLGSWGKKLMLAGVIILVLGLLRLALPSSGNSKRHARYGSYYHVVLPRWSQNRGVWLEHGGRWSSSGPTEPSSPVELNSPVPSLDEEEFISLPSIPIRMRPTSPALSESTDLIPSTNELLAHPAISAVWRTGHRVVSSLWGSRDQMELPGTPSRTRRRGRGVYFYLPAMFNASQDSEVPSRRSPRPSMNVDAPPPRYAPSAPYVPDQKQRLADELENLVPEVSGSSSLHGRSTPAESTATSYFMTPGVHAFPGTRTPSQLSRPPSRAS